MKGDTWTFVETARSRKVRQRTLHLTTMKGAKNGSRSDLRSSLALDAGARMIICEVREILAAIRLKCFGLEGLPHPLTLIVVPTWQTFSESCAVSEVLVNQNMNVFSRPSMESKNATRRCGNLLRKC